MLKTNVKPRIDFVEDKRPDFATIAALLATSQAANRWTNLGPVWLALKHHIERVLELPADRCAIPCASGTHALMAAAALAERRGRLRWLCPDYAFRATAVGPFADATFHDCSAAGTLDVGILHRVDAQSYDGLVVLNPFGLLRAMDETVDFARRLGKPLIIDNAHGFVGFVRTDHAGVFECISLHHTKPFGFGEGGCLIVDRELEADACGAMDFGYAWPWPTGHHALSNGKLSEPAAAFVLDRLQRASDWMDGYRRQFDRIVGIGKRHGFRLLIDEHDVGDGVRGNAPLLAPAPISAADLGNDLLALRKYYPPITGLPMSTRIHATIINVPCHPGVAAAGDEEVAGLLAELARRARERERERQAKR